MATKSARRVSTLERRNARRPSRLPTQDPSRCMADERMLSIECSLHLAVLSRRSGEDERKRVAVSMADASGDRMTMSSR